MKIRLITAGLMISMLLVSCAGQGVSGKVINGETGKPLSGASVKLKCSDCPDNFSARTDAEGSFAFPEISGGNYLLSIVWSSPPACPGIQPFETVGSSGDFIISYAGYAKGGIGGLGTKQIIAVAEFKLNAGQGRKFNLKLSCP